MKGVRIAWSTAMIRVLLGAHRAGLSQQRIATMLGVSPSVVRRRLEALRKSGEFHQHENAPPHDPDLVTTDQRAPLPPGDYRSWGAISNENWPQDWPKLK